MSNDSPAFPVVFQHDFGDGVGTESRKWAGMSLRDYFAAHALVHPYTQGDDTDRHADKAATWAYQVADAMLKERCK